MSLSQQRTNPKPVLEGRKNVYHEEMTWLPGFPKSGGRLHHRYKRLIHVHEVITSTDKDLDESAEMCDALAGLCKLKTSSIVLKQKHQPMARLDSIDMHP